MTVHAHSGLDRARNGLLPLADPSEQPGKVRFGCVRLRCSTSVEWCGARHVRTGGKVGSACYGCELGAEHQQHAGKPKPLSKPKESKRERAIRDIDAVRHASVRDRRRKVKRQRTERKTPTPRSSLRDPVVGEKFGEWVSQGEIGRCPNGRRQVLLKCHCGTERKALWSNVLRGDVGKQCRSCALASREGKGRRYLTHNGQRLCVNEWARRKGIHSVTLLARLRKGWPVAKALETPVTERVKGGHPRYQIKPCRKCGGPKDTEGRGQVFCSKCKAGV